MNILVCMKIVSRSTFSDSISDTDERLSGGNLGINPADMYALELALRIKDRNPAAMVTVVTMAPLYAEKALRDCLAMGADNAVLISDERAAGSDTLATAKILSAAIRKMPKQDLILCGKKAIDSETGHIGPQLSVMLDMPVLTGVLSFSAEGGKTSAVCVRDGVTMSCNTDSHALLTVVNGTDMVRRPTIKGLRNSKTKEIKCFSLDDLRVDPRCVGFYGSPTRTVSIENISFKRGKQKTVTDAGEGAGELLKLLKKEVRS